MPEQLPAAQEPGWVLCPGCRQRSGPPGALCPGCGSKLPQPQKAESAGALLAIGVVVGLVGYAIYAATGHGGFGALVTVIGVIAFGVGLAQGKDVAVASAPSDSRLAAAAAAWWRSWWCLSGAALLWSQGGPAMAALALPVWVPLSWAVELGSAVRRSDPPTTPPRNRRPGRSPPTWGRGAQDRCGGGHR